MKRKIPPVIYKLMLMGAALIWGSSFIVMKDTMDAFPPSWLIGIRFTLTALVLTVAFFPRTRRAIDRRTITYGIVLGVLIFAAYWFQTVGLNFTTPGKNAFLTDTYCVLVPFIFWVVAKRRPTRYNLIAAILCLAGIGFVSLSNEAFSVGFGDFMTVIGGVVFGIHIVATSLFTKSKDAVVLTVFQFWVSGILGIIVGAFTETPPDFASIPLEYALNMGYLVIMCTCVAMVFQNVSLEHVAPSQAALLLSLESVFGVMFSVAFYGEALTPPLVIGFVLIFCAIVLSEAFPLKKPPDQVDASLSNDMNVVE